ncbi:uncharacterized protein MELLADRAFT_112500 [Melampsora larici-populina 98AG31]|uniref:Uncharacterized protein n=1 Tax=Melampsora larici-populina (strain 98AG31 / pathotype 3-4-7) TaxID=747676 RepID=F4S6N9_MELLP|nr:uncharacterized protein MELLADRAFT_112500 [Melampsora larici-populina 98AG31]EGF99726.1 hypothetical protein MELLADRAFT_112500 [Melampsora larici-populina 98AG31]
MPPKCRIPPRRPSGYDPASSLIKHHNEVSDSIREGYAKGKRRASEEPAIDELADRATPELGELESNENLNIVKIEVEEDSSSIAPTSGTLEYIFPVQVSPHNIDYWTLQNLIRRASMYNYLEFAGLDEDQIQLVIPILREKQVTNWDLFLFRDYINGARLEGWGIPYGICVRIVVHANLFYRHLLIRHP